MKKSIIIFVVLCGGIACAIVYFQKQKTSPAPAMTSSANQTAPQTLPDKIAAPISETPQTISANANEPAHIPVSTATAVETNSDSSTNSIHKMVDALLNAKSAEEKHDLFQKLIKSGQMDAAIAELKERATQNPNDAEIPTTLGEAQLNQLRAMRDAGNDDYSAIGILAMQADQSFAAALKIDPQNWEAQFVKNASMYYWPSNPQMDNQVVQNLSKLIDQQETMTTQPEFAQTFLVLGNEYQKIGQPDKAQATWQLGAQKFPDNPDLQKKLAGANQ